MAFSRASNNADGEQCIDPKFLTLGHGDVDPDLSALGHGFEEPEYNTDIQQVIDGEEFPLVSGEQVMSHCFDANGFSGTGEPGVTLAPPANGDEHMIGSYVSRPILKLDTDIPHERRITHQGAGKSPTTPEIRVSDPEGSRLLGFGAITKPATRSRSHSSPARRSTSDRRGRSRSPTGRGQPITLSSNAQHLSPTSSPITTEKFILNHSYHAGDHTAQINVVGGDGPQSPARVHGQPTAPTSSPSSRTSGPYFCNEQDCKDSHKIFNTPSDLDKHRRKHKPESERPHGCSKCARRFWFPKDVTRHMKVHTGEHEQCPFCGKQLSRDDNLARHIANKHKNLTGVPQTYQPPTPPTSNGNGLNLGHTGWNRGTDYTPSMTAASPSASSITSFDLPSSSSYSGTRPGTPMTYSPVLYHAPLPSQRPVQPARPDWSPAGGDPFSNARPVATANGSRPGAAKPQPPLYAPPMMRSRSDIH